MNYFSFISTSDKVQVPVRTRFRLTPIVRDNQTGRIQFSLWKSDPRFNRTTSYVLHQIASEEVGRLDKISTQYYGTPEYHWVIADANDLVDQVADMRIGEFLKIPNRAVIDSYFTRGVDLQGAGEP